MACNTSSNIKKKKIDAVLVNLRLSPKSLKRWELLPSFYNSLLDCFGEIFVQSKLDQQRIAKISKREIKFVGNLKLTPASSNLQKKQLNNVKRKLNTKYLMLASTHLGEESILLPVIKNLLEEFNDLHIIIAPRHPERSSEIFDLYSSYNLKSQILSQKKDKEDKDTDIRFL